MFDRIVFATDLSVASDEATDYAVALADKFGAKVTVVHAIEPMRSLGEKAEFDELYTRLQEEAEKRASNVLEKFKAAGVDAELDTDVGKRWEVVVAKAAELDANLIVMGSHATRDGDKIYMGTTSHKVFLMAPCPVLVVR